MKTLVTAIFELSKERNVDLNVAAVMYSNENGVDTTEASKFIHENYTALCAARQSGNTDEWDAIFEAPVVPEEAPEAEVEETEAEEEATEETEAE